MKMLKAKAKKLKEQIYRIDDLIRDKESMLIMGATWTRNVFESLRVRNVEREVATLKGHKKSLEAQVQALEDAYGKFY